MIKRKSLIAICVAILAITGCQKTSGFASWYQNKDYSKASIGQIELQLPPSGNIVEPNHDYDIPDTDISPKAENVILPPDF